MGLPERPRLPLGQAGQSRERHGELEAAIREVEAATSEVQNARMDPEALRHIHEVYGYLRPFERKELFSILVQRVEVTTKMIVLHLRGVTLNPNGEGKTAESGRISQFSPVRLSDLVPQSRLPSGACGVPGEHSEEPRTSSCPARMDGQVKSGDSSTRNFAKKFSRTMR